MEVIVFLSAVFLCLLYYMYHYVKIDRMVVGKDETKKLTDKQALVILILLGAVIRIAFGVNQSDKATDLGNFRWMANTIMNNGYMSVYESGVSISFPPLLVHLMAFVGFLCKLLGLDATAVATTAAGIVFRLPSICCDLVLIAFVYKIAKKNFRTRSAMLLAAALIVNPCSVMDTSIWGQVDGIVSLCIVLMCWFLYQKKSGFAVIAFTVGVLMNPLSLVFVPVLIIGIVDDLLLDGIEAKNIIRFVICLAGSVIGGVISCMPMGIGTVWNNFMDTRNAFPYCSVNAYNFWTMLGLNWKSETSTYLGLTGKTWGTVFVCLFVGAGIVLHYINKRKKLDYFYLAAFSMITVFTFAIRMHERYLFIAIPLLLVLFAIKPAFENYLYYIVFTMVQFGNMIFVFYKYDAAAYNPNEPFPDMVAKLVFLSFIYFAAMTVYRIRHKEDIIADNMELVKEVEKTADKIPFVERTSKMPKWTKYDTIVLLIIVVAYSAFALHDIGYRYAPETQWSYNTGTEDSSNEIILDLGEIKEIGSINYFLGNYENRVFQVQVADTLDGAWSDAEEFTMVSVFCWGEKAYTRTGRYIKLTCTSDKVVIFELAIEDPAENVLLPVNAAQYSNLFDEQEMFPGRSTFRDSTYFDEIYHARTAYEYIHGLTTYENTHPPLGKIIMSIGVRIFGMNPFGWRIAGILFGIGMIPIFYAFSRRIFKETWIAAVSTTLFAFDFMHFSQTRIATIDVFVTFFIILMYYFMYKYYETSFYDTPLKKTFVTLALCGFTMGLAIASKWTGVYASIGLAIIFFITLGKRFREYLYAKKNIEGSTNGISHEYIVNNFRGFALKTIGFCCIVFVVVPAIIYTLSYIPFKDYVGTEGLIARMLKNQELMLTYHQGVNQDHPYSSRWWQWPIIYRPIWYFSGHVSDTVSEGISAFGNPAVWWAGIVAFFALLQRSIRKKDKTALFMVIGYLSQYLPWVLIGRTTFIYHYFTSVPFVVFMVAYCMYLLVKEKKWPKPVIYAYVVLAIVLFVLFYPVLSGQPIEKEFVFKFLRWMKSWVLVS